MVETKRYCDRCGRAIQEQYKETYYEIVTKKIKYFKTISCYGQDAMVDDPQVKDLCKDCMKDLAFFFKKGKRIGDPDPIFKNIEGEE